MFLGRVWLPSENGPRFAGCRYSARMQVQAREGNTMLVLRRKPNETIRIGDDVCITIISVEGGVVKLGVEAPHRVSVHRGEIFQRIQMENRMAAADLPSRLSNLAKKWRESKLREREEEGRDPESAG